MPTGVVVVGHRSHFVLCRREVRGRGVRGLAQAADAFQFRPPILVAPCFLSLMDREVV
jgi:hypothetical protein